VKQPVYGSTRVREASGARNCDQIAGIVIDWLVRRSHVKAAN
jgi:hypothetical protein